MTKSAISMARCGTRLKKGAFAHQSSCSEGKDIKTSYKTRKQEIQGFLISADPRAHLRSILLSAHEKSNNFAETVLFVDQSSSSRKGKDGRSAVLPAIDTDLLMTVILLINASFKTPSRLFSASNSRMCLAVWLL